MWYKIKIYAEFCLVMVEENNHMKDLDVHLQLSFILKWVLRNLFVRIYTGITFPEESSCFVCRGKGKVVPVLN
jgi:hypothetical protein